MLTLALGIGVNIAMFSVVYGVLLRPLAYKDADQLVQFRTERAFSGRAQPVQTNFSLVDLDEWRKVSHSLESVAFVANWDGKVSDESGTEPVAVAIVSDEFFSLVGGEIALGRPLGLADDNAPTVVVSSRLWHRRLGGSPTAIGSRLILDSQPYTIVGVADESFQVPSVRTDVWRTAGFARTLAPALARRGSGGFLPIARLKPGMTIEQARRDCVAVLNALAADQQSYADTRAMAMGLREQIVADIRPALLILLAAVSLVLFVACANVANLLLVKNAARSREFAIRTALGASRGRLIMQASVYSALMATGGAAFSLAVAASVIALLKRLQPVGLPRLDAVHLDWPVLLFGLFATAATALAVGLVAAFQSTNRTPALRFGAMSVTGSPPARRLQKAVVVAELAVSLVLLIGSALLAGSFVRLMRSDIGVRTDLVTAALIEVPREASSLVQRRVLIGRVLAGVGSMPGVTSVGAGVALPPNRAMLRITMNRVDEAIGQPANYLVDAVLATPGFFSTLGVRLQKGRFFTDADAEGHPQVMIMSVMTARQMFGDGEPIGRTVALPILTGTSNRAANAPVMVVGIVDDVKYSGLEAQPDGVIYRPFAQQPWPMMFIVARTAEGLTGMNAALRREIASIDPSIVVHSVDPLDRLVSDAAGQPRFRAVTLVGLAVLAVALATVGLYGVVAHTVAQRTGEIGIRMALGATAEDVMWLVLREGMAMAATGLTIGLLAARALTRTLAGLLYGLQPTDAVSFLAAATVLLFVTAVASYVPARRASRVDPLVSLRSD